MFDQLLKRLLQGEFICEISDEAGFRFLQDPENAGQADAFLTRLDYRLSSTQNQMAFYAAYRTIDSEARSDIRKVFQQFRVELQPVVEWLDILHPVKNCVFSKSWKRKVNKVSRQACALYECYSGNLR